MYQARPRRRAGSNSQYSSLEGIPSEDINGIDVYKNPQASMTEGGIGGTIDLKTRDPLQQPLGLSGGGNFRESISTGAGGAKPDGTLVGSYRFNDRFAVTAASRMTRKTRSPRSSRTRTATSGSPLTPPPGHMWVP